MASFKIYQGDSYYIPFALEQSNYVLTPEMVADLRLTVGEKLRYSLSDGELLFDYDKQLWYFRPSQDDTLGLKPGSYKVMAKVKYRNDPADVISSLIGTLVVLDAADVEGI